MYKELESVLRCPITKTSMRLMEKQEISEMNGRVKKKEMLHYDGSSVEKELSVAYISENGKYIYPVEEHIIVLLPNLSITVNKSDINQDPLRAEKQNAQNFYNEIGWHKGSDGQFIDAEKCEDLRPVAKEYIHKCHMRVKRHIKQKGKYLLDVASGPIQYPEYLSYSEDFEYRICVDISFRALQEARKKLGDKGIYILGDITNLPFQDNALDAIVSLHTIYHVPADEQRNAFHEVHRALKEGCTAVVVYSWGEHSLLMDWAFRPRNFFLVRLLLFLVRSFKRKTAPELSNEEQVEKPKLYFHRHPYSYFINQDWNFKLDIMVWRSININFSKAYAKKMLLGRTLLALIYFWEEAFPRYAGQIGQYPMFIIRK